MSSHFTFNINVVHLTTLWGSYWFNGIGDRLWQ
jgi:hypothetical protein